MINLIKSLLGSRDSTNCATENTPTPWLPSSAPVHILTDDGLIRLIDGHLAFVRPDGCEERVRFDEVSQLSLFGNAGVTSPALRELMHRGIPVLWRSRSGHYLGQTADLSGGATAIRRAQYAAAADAKRAFAIARVLVRAKIANARGLVRRSNERLPGVLDTLQRRARQVEKTSSPAELFGVEGAAGASFYAALPQLISPARRQDFPWDGRRRRPPTDAMNALLSYLYAVVTGECAAAALARGFDPTVGFFHAERPGRPALALDLVEPFRPVIADAVALATINRGEVRPNHFENHRSAVSLNEQGRRIVLGALERRFSDSVPGLGARGAPMTWREAITAQTHRLARSLQSGEPFASFERD